MPPAGRPDGGNEETRRTVDRPTAWLALLVPLALALTACGDGGDRGGTLELPRFEQPNLVSGRSVWMQVCRNCHLKGIDGAPAIDDTQAWGPRLDKPAEQLYRSALQGIRGENDWRMPPRGGNAGLSDTQVRNAVDYMRATVQYLAER